jgi:hypothetical protein
LLSKSPCSPPRWSRVDHLELLFEFGLGTGDGGPWRGRLGDVLATPAELDRGQLGWATGHGELVEYLVAHGAPAPSLDPVDAFIANDRAQIGRLRLDHPGIAGEIRPARPALVAWAAAAEAASEDDN